MYVGQVTDNKDPKKLGRIRARIQGIADQGTAWALPMGWPGAGAKKRGGWVPVPIGAEVNVWFAQGDIEHPHYMPGNPGEGEAPDEVEEASVAEAADDIPFIFNGKRFKIIVDERPGKARVALEDLKTKDMFEIDGVALGLKLKATTAVDIESNGAVRIKGSSVIIQGRTVTRNTKPI